MAIKFRYYFEKELIESWVSSNSEWDRRRLDQHNRIISLLQEIKKQYNIDYELFEFSRNDEKKIYKEHFVSRAQILSKVLDESVSRALRSRRGRGHIYLHDVIAIVENNQVIWFNMGYWRDYDKWKSYDNDNPMTIGLLKCILNEPEYLRKILDEIRTIRLKRKSIHEELVEKFISNIEGTIEREVEVGRGFIVYDKWGVPKTVGRYKIDIVWKTGIETFVIEVKEQLNFEAIGQAIVYKELYKKEYPNENIKSGIVCEIADKELLEIAEKYVDRIWYNKVLDKKEIVWG